MIYESGVKPYILKVHDINLSESTYKRLVDMLGEERADNLMYHSHSVSIVLKGWEDGIIKTHWVVQMAKYVGYPIYTQMIIDRHGGAKL